MEDLPQLYTTSGKKTDSESSEGREADYLENPDILGPLGNDNLILDSELFNYVKTPKLLTREGREQLRGLRSNLGGPYGQRRLVRLNENPVTPRQDIETPSQSFTTQTRADLPRQSEKRKPLSRLFRWVSLPESQFKAVTPRDTETTEQEAIDYSVPPPRRRSIPSPEFIDQTFEVDPRGS